jgi:hypothetical protein
MAQRYRDDGDGRPPPKDRPEPGWEVWLFRFAVGLFVASRIALAWQQKINSDEPQHAHVAWAWAHGLIQYRDVFDNHTPLFHLLSAPLVILIGERADILALLRCAIIGLNLVTLFLVWRICRSLFSAQAGRWAVIALAFFPPFFIEGAEFRTDSLWATLWIAWTALVTSKADLSKKFFWGGLLLAACFGTSLKSVLPLVTAALAFAGAFLLQRRYKPESARLRPLVVLRGLVLGLAGFSILAGGILCFFIALGAGPSMYRCVIQHNLTGDDVDFLHRLLSGLSDPRFWYFIPATYFVAFQLRKLDDPGRRFRIAFLALFAGFYPLVLRLLWPVVTGQDFLPYYPLLFVCALPLLFWLVRLVPQQMGLPQWAGLTSFLVILSVEPEWSAEILLRQWHPDPINADRISEVLRVTKPTETVLDPKGDVVLRPRPIYDVLELFTMTLYRDAVLPDRIPEQLIANHTMVAVWSDRYPERTRRFLQENYLWTGRLLIAGIEMHENAKGQFRLSLGGSYVFLGNGHLLSGKLNGVSISGKAEMQPGVFEFVPDTADWPVTVQWERAYEIGIIGRCSANLPWRETRPPAGEL